MPSTSSPPSCAPRWSTRRTDRATYGGAVAAVAERLGTPLMPWQRHVADVALEVQGPDDPHPGRLVYRQVGLTVPRQAGKTTLVLALTVWRALQWRRQKIVYTAQTAQDAREKWREEHLPAVELSPFADMMTPRKSNGSEGFMWHNGSRYGLMATMESSGHGKTLDLAVIDEAFAQSDNRLEQATKPAMITRPEPQLWVISTAGTADSVYLRSKVDRGREAVQNGLTSKVAYFEWSAADEDDPADPATWQSCHPAIGHTIDLDAIAAEFESMELAEFERAFLNRWTQGVTAAPIPVSSWNRREDRNASLGADVTFAVDMTPDRESASIAASDGVTVELIDRATGTDWVLGRVIQLWDRWSPVAVVLDSVGPAASLVPDLEDAGVRVITTNSRDMAQACGRMFDAVVNGKVVHTGQPELTAALTGAAKRKLGDAWAFTRSGSPVDISPLVAATLAHWGATTLERAAPEAAPVFIY